MRIPNWIYRSERVGKNGKLFSAYKIRTLKEGIDKTSSFAQANQYLKYGKFLRKTKLDELPQIFNVLKREMNIVGVRPEELRSIRLIPRELRTILLSRKPGLTSLASLHFIDEEFILSHSRDQAKDYFEKIKPAKLVLDAFYVQNKCFLLDLAIIWMTVKVVFKRLLLKR